MHAAVCLVESPIPPFALSQFTPLPAGPQAQSRPARPVKANNPPHLAGGYFFGKGINVTK
jgi:hypothetical protein